MYKRKDRKSGLDEADKFFIGKEHIYQDQIIDYKGSPSGHGYIGLNKQPLIPNDNGIGYKGVLMQSVNRNLVQCSECGERYKLITPAHLKKHGLTIDEYKEKYGLNKSQPLVSDTYSRFYSTNMIDVVNKNLDISYEKKVKSLEKARKKKDYKKNKKYNTDQMKNNQGTCDLQLKHRFFSYLSSYHRYPPKDKYPYAVLRDRFGSVNNALKAYGLPTRQKFGYTTLYEFGDGYTFKLTSGKGYEDLFQIMQMKCISISNTIF